MYKKPALISILQGEKGGYEYMLRYSYLTRLGRMCKIGKYDKRGQLMPRLHKLVFGALFMFSLALQGQDLCNKADLKPILTLDQITQAELVDILCELTGLKSSPQFPKANSSMTPEAFFQKEVALLIDNGFPVIFLDVNPKALVNRRFFSSLMFEIAMEKDPLMQKDCKTAATETQQLNCLMQHDYVFSKSLSIYRSEVLSVLCSKRNVLTKLAPKQLVKPPDIYPEEFKEGILLRPGTRASRYDPL